MGCSFIKEHAHGLHEDENATDYPLNMHHAHSGNAGVAQHKTFSSKIIRFTYAQVTLELPVITDAGDLSSRKGRWDGWINFFQSLAMVVPPCDTAERQDLRPH